MGEEQVLRSEPPPPPSKANDDKTSGGRGGGGEPPRAETFEKFVFWIERVAVFLLISCWVFLFLVISCWVPSNPWHFLPMLLLIVSYSFYFINFMVSQESGKDKNGTDKKKIEQEKAKLDFSLNESKEELVKAKDGRNKMDEENTGQEKAKSKDSKEEAKAKGEGNNKIDEENTRREKAKLDFSLNESKEEVKAKDGRNKMDEENTGQEKASSNESKEEVKAKDGRNKMDEENTGQEKASSKESKEEVKPKDEGNNKINEENTGGEKAKLDLSLKVSQEEVKAKDGRIVDEFHGWEEERSQLMYELGAARASMEIYRELLHDLHHHQP